MKLALCQMEIVWEDVLQNQLKMEHFVEAAYKQSVECIVFPEMCMTGFTINMDCISHENDKIIPYVSALAIRYGLHIGFGWAKNQGSSEKAENHFTMIAPTGEVISDYIKIHPFSYAKEDQYFRGGEEIASFSLLEFQVSTFICYDLRFPEIFQIASTNSKFIIVSANWPEKRREHWKCLLKARAIENQVYIAGVNCFGEVGGISYIGDSCIIDPLGNVRAEMSQEEGILIYDLKNDVEQYRNEFPVKQDRKRKLYKRYYNS